MVSSVNFLTGVLLARYLGLEEFGVFTLAWLSILFFSSLQMAALISPMMSIGPKRERAVQKTYYGAVVLQQIIFSCVCALILFVSVWGSSFLFPQWQVSTLAFPLSLVLLAQQLQDFLRRYYFVRERKHLAFVSDAISYLGQVGVLLVLFQFKELSINDVLLVIATTSALGVLPGFREMTMLPFGRHSFVVTTAQHWRSSKWLVGSNLLRWASGNLFLIVAGSIAGASAVGGYRVAEMLVGGVNIIVQGMENFVPSKASTIYHQSGIERMVDYLKTVSFIGGVSVFVICVLVSLFSEQLLKLLYGEEYLIYSYMVWWFSVIYFISFFVSPITAGLRALENTKPLFEALVLMTIFSALSAYPLVWSLGIDGAVVGVLIVSILRIYFLLNCLRKRV